ncbi:hypothetical protein PIB30_091178, partial [Stylosanthes scabra]|nr:hypothetical protein [Stylosanthes scabra]
MIVPFGNSGLRQCRFSMGELIYLFLVLNIDINRLNLNIFTIRIRVSVIRVHRGVMDHRPYMAFKIFFPMPSVGAFTSGFESSILPSSGMFKSTINLLIFVPATPLDCVSRPTSEALDPPISTNTTNNSNRMIVGK